MDVNHAAYTIINMQNRDGKNIFLASCSGQSVWEGGWEGGRKNVISMVLSSAQGNFQLICKLFKYHAMVPWQHGPVLLKPGDEIQDTQLNNTNQD